jgi:hypothetical protein
MYAGSIGLTVAAHASLRAELVPLRKNLETPGRHVGAWVKFGDSRDNVRRLAPGEVSTRTLAGDCAKKVRS